MPKNAELHVDFNTSLAAEGQDVAITCRVYPFEVYYSRRFLEGLRNLTQNPGVEDMRAAAMKELNRWRASQQARVFRSIVRRQRVTLDVRVEAPVVLVPETTREGRSRLLVVDLGQLVLCNVEPGPEAIEGQDSWSLKMTNMQLAMCRHGLLYLERREEAADLSPIIEAFDLNFRVQTFVDTGSATLTRAEVDVCLPRLAINLRASTVQYFHRLKDRRKSRAEASRLAAVRALEAPPVQPNSDTPSPPAASTPDSTAGRVLSITVRAPDILFTLEDDEGGSPMVNAAIAGVSGSLTSQGTRSEAKVELGSLHLVDQHPFSDESFKALAGPLPMNQEEEEGGPAHATLVVLTLTSTVKEGTVVDLALRPFQLQWNPETVAGLQRFFADNHRRPPTSPLSASSSSPTKAPPEAAHAPEPVDSKPASSKRRAPPFRLCAHLDRLSLLLNKEGELRRLLGLTIDAADLTFESVGGVKQLIGTLTGLTATDLCNLGTAYPRVLEKAPDGGAETPLVIHLKVRGG